MSKFFVNTGDGTDLYDTAEEAAAAAQRAIDGWRDCCDPGWPEEVNQVCWGPVFGMSFPESRGENGDFVEWVLNPQLPVDELTSERDKLAAELAAVRAEVEGLRRENEFEKICKDAKPGLEWYAKQESPSANDIAMHRWWVGVITKRINTALAAIPSPPDSSSK